VLLMHFSGSVAFPQVRKKFRREAMGVVDTRDRAASHRVSVPRRRRPLSSWRPTVMTEEPPEVTFVTTRTMDTLPPGARDETAARNAVVTPPASARRFGPSREGTPSSSEIPSTGTPEKAEDFAADCPRPRARPSTSASARLTRQHRAANRLDHRAAQAGLAGAVVPRSSPFFPPPSMGLLPRTRTLSASSAGATCSLEALICA